MVPPHARFQPVRSAVKENALWSLVVVATHAALLPPGLAKRMLKRLREVAMSEDCIICVGFALDAANRLSVELTAACSADSASVKATVADLLAKSPLLNFDGLSRADPANWESYMKAAKEADAHHREHGYGGPPTQASPSPSARDNY